MPMVNRGDGTWVSFKFDPETVARMLYAGMEVRPDQSEWGDSEEITQQKNLLVDDSLQKLWGNQQARTGAETWSLRSPAESLTEDDRFGLRIQPPGQRNQGQVQMMKPNPTVKYHLPAVRLMKLKSIDL